MQAPHSTCIRSTHLLSVCPPSLRRRGAECWTCYEPGARDVIHVHIILVDPPEAVSLSDRKDETRKQRVQRQIPKTTRLDVLETFKAPIHQYVNGLLSACIPLLQVLYQGDSYEGRLWYCHSLSVTGHDRPRRVEPDLGLFAILWQMLIDGDSSIETCCKHDWFS